jgi:hypothetical protein
MKYGNANCGQMSFINAKTYVNVYGANETEVQIGKDKVNQRDKLLVASAAKGITRIKTNSCLIINNKPKALKYYV